MDADRNLLFGVLALQADLISAAQFAEACSAWAVRKTDALADLLVERRWLTPADRTDVIRLLDRKLKKHGGDVRASLAEVIAGPVGNSLAGTTDPAVRESLADLLPGGGPVHLSTGEFIPEARDRYTLSRLHATGGLGRVWLARDVPLNRDVALKEIRPERADRPSAGARFLREAQITGQLEHPGIVPVYELGRREADGQPFYTMRFVRGRTLAEAARHFHERRRGGRVASLEFRQLLTAFVAVCQAVAFAHARGVVHRDLKPQNVVLGDFGEVIVLDWGLAKIVGRPDELDELPIDVDRSGPDGATVQGQVLGTPAYMPPEQADGRLDLLDQRADVYGLGAILYEVLAGRPPFAGNDTQDVLARVRSAKPESARSAWSEVPRSLEAVCLKALAKKRDDRYPSATAVAIEVQHWLADEPVTVFREPLPTRAARWARRHRPLVTGAAAVLVVSVAALTTGTILLQRANAATTHERDVARQQRDRADAMSGRARRAVDDFYTQFSEQLADMPGLQLVRRELLEAALRYYQEFAAAEADDPVVRAELALAHWRAGMILHETATPAQSAEAYRKAIAIQAELVHDHPDQLEFANDLAASWMSLGLVLTNSGDRTAGLVELRRAVDLREELVRRAPDVRAYQRNLASCYSNLAAVLYDGPSGNPDAAAALRNDELALALREQLVAAEPGNVGFREELGATYNNLGTWHYTSGTPADALAYYDQARKVREEIRTRRDSPVRRLELAKTWYNIGLAHRRAGAPSDALKAEEKAAALLDPLVQENPRVTAYRRLFAEVSNGLGVLYAEARRTAPALEAFRRAATLRDEIVRDNPDVRPYRAEQARAILNVGTMYQKAGRPADATDPLQRAVAAYRKLAGEDPADRVALDTLALALSNLGVVQTETGDREAAIASLDEAVATYGRLLAADPGNATCLSARAMAWDNQGVALGGLKRWGDARSAYRRAESDERSALARRPGDRRLGRQIADHLLGVVKASAELGEPAEAAGVLPECARLFSGDPDGLYDVACGYALCVPAVGKGKTELSDREQADRKAYAAQGIAALKAAVAAGYRNTAHMKKDRDLDAIRSRADFKELIASLEEPPREAGPPPHLQNPSEPR